MSTVPGGSTQSPSAATDATVEFGSASHRSLSAPSDQNGALGAYGTRPEAGCVGLPGTTQPVWLRSEGTGDVFAPEPGSKRNSPPSEKSTKYNSPLLPSANADVVTPLLASSVVKPLGAVPS